MRITEVLICVLLVSIILTAALNGYGGILKNSKNVLERSKYSVQVLELDSLLRDQICKVNVPYLETSEEWYETIKNNIGLVLEKRKADLIDVARVYDDQGHCVGVSIFWEKNGKKIETYDLFSGYSLVQKNEK